MTEPRDKSDAASRAAAESLERFRAAADRERESRGGPRVERLRVLDETIREEARAIGEFSQSIDLHQQAVEERNRENARPDPVEEAGETTAADSVPTPTGTRPVGEGTAVEVEGEGGEV